MADPSEINPKLHSADADLSGHHGPAEKIYRLTRGTPAAKDAPGAGEAAKPESKARPEDRKPEARPSDERPLVPAALDSARPRRLLRRPLMFALVLIIGGYFYVTGGAVMSTDNAYVQADMVGLSTDVSGIVTERETCYAWATAHILIGLPLNLLLPRTDRMTSSDGPVVKPHITIDRTMVLLSFAFAAAWTLTSAMAAHLPRIVEAFGATPAQAVFAGMMIGPAQVAARVLEASLLSRFHPLVPSPATFLELLRCLLPIARAITDRRIHSELGKFTNAVNG